MSRLTVDVSRFDTGIDDAIKVAFEDLPDGYEIVVRIACKSGSVELIDPEGESIEYPSNFESLAEQIRDAVEYVIRQEAEWSSWVQEQETR